MTRFPYDDSAHFEPDAHDDETLAEELGRIKQDLHPVDGDGGEDQYPRQ